MQVSGIAAILLLVCAQAMSRPQPQNRLRPWETLTDRQRQCLGLASQGLSSRAIGEALGLSPRTVDEHFARACDLLGVRTRTQAVALVTVAECDGSCWSRPASADRPGRKQVDRIGKAYKVGLAARAKPV